MTVEGHHLKLAGHFPVCWQQFLLFPADVAGELKVEVGRHQGWELLPVCFADGRANRRGWTGIPEHYAEDEGRGFKALTGWHNRKLLDAVKKDKDSYMLWVLDGGRWLAAVKTEGKMQTVKRRRAQEDESPCLLCSKMCLTNCVGTQNI